MRFFTHPRFIVLNKTCNFFNQILLFKAISIYHVTSQNTETSSDQTFHGGSRRSVSGTELISPRRVSIWVRSRPVPDPVSPTVRPRTTNARDRTRDLVWNPANGFVSFARQSGNDRSNALTGDTSDGGVIDPSQMTTFRVNSGFQNIPERNSVGNSLRPTDFQRNFKGDSSKGFNWRTSSDNNWTNWRTVQTNQEPKSRFETNAERNDRIEAEKRRVREENIRKKYRNNAFLNTRGLVSGIRLPTRWQETSRDSSFLTNRNLELMSPGTDASDQNRGLAFSRRAIERPVVNLNDEQTTDIDDRQAARDQLRQVSVSRSAGANRYLKSLLYNALRRVNSN